MLGQQIINGVMLGSVYAMVAVALVLSIGVLNFLNFSIPAMFMVGGMATWAFISAGLPWPAAAVAALIAVAVASQIVELFTWRWLRGADRLVPLVSSTAFLILFEHLAIAFYGSDMRPVQAGFEQIDLRIGSLVIGIPQLIGLICSVALIWALSRLFRRTQLGRALRTIAEDPDTALVLGININRVVPVVFIVAGAFAGLAGVIFALNYRQVHPFMGEAVGLKGIAAMIVGGMGNIWGAIAGGLAIGIAEVFAIGYLGADFVDIAVFGLLLLILVFRPTGLFSGTAAGRGGI